MKFLSYFFHRLFFHIPQPLWIILCVIARSEATWQSPKVFASPWGIATPVWGLARNDSLDLQAGIDIGGNISDIVLQVGIFLLQRHFHFLDGVEDGGVILAELLADVGQAQVGQLPDQIDGNLPGFGVSSME